MWKRKYVYMNVCLYKNCSYHADLRNTWDNKFVDEVILSSHFTEKEVDFLFMGDETWADESWIYHKIMANNTKD